MSILQWLNCSLWQWRNICLSKFSLPLTRVHIPRQCMKCIASHSLQLLLPLWAAPKPSFLLIWQNSEVAKKRKALFQLSVLEVPVWGNFILLFWACSKAAHVGQTSWYSRITPFVARKQKGGRIHGLNSAKAHPQPCRISHDVLPPKDCMTSQQHHPGAL